MIVWIIGLSGSGKSTLAHLVSKEVRLQGKKIVLLDGDEVRNLFGNDLGHDIKSREIAVERISRLCLFLDKQEIDVICSTVLHFPKWSDWCRNNLSNYFEVFIDAPLSQVMDRDIKGIYRQYENGEIDNVAGLDLPFSRPLSDLTIINDGTKKAFLMKAEPIIHRICNSADRNPNV